MEAPTSGLIRLVHHVAKVGWGDTTTYSRGTLVVDRNEAAAFVSSPALADVRLSWVSPGESARLVKVLDAVEPRTKGRGGAGMFPGFCGPAEPQGTGETHVLRGAAVISAGYLPRAQEAVVDMSGPAAELSPMGSTHNLVVEFTPAESAAWEDVDVALRQGTLRLAARLAEAALNAAPDVVEEVAPVAGSNGDRPRVGVVTNLQTQGAFKDVFFYGRSFGGSAPTLVDPAQLDDGAVVSGQYGHPALKNPTYLHQNHPVLAALRARGDDVIVAGLVLCPEPVDATQKEQVSAQAAQLCADAGFDAAIITKEGGGNADADVALKMDALEDLGVTAVGLFAEMSGAEGIGQPLVVSPEKATAMVSTGNYDHRVTLPAVERAFGGDRLALLDVPATEEMKLPIAVVYCAASPLGWGRLRCVAGPSGGPSERETP